MILKSILSDTTLFFWFSFHVILGFISAITPFPLIIFFYITFLLSIKSAFNFKSIDNSLTFIIIYLVSFEMIARMAQTSPFIPYELGKYLLMFLLFLGIINGNNRGLVGLLMFCILLPAILYDYSNLVTDVDIRFNLLGPLNVGLSICYFYKQRISEPGLIKIIRLLTLPLISILSFTIIKTPDFENIEFSLNANFETSGGFGSNQVSTFLGLGMFLSFFALLYKISISGFRFLDIVIFLSFSFQGLLTFSRGGIIGGVIGILLVLFFLLNSSTLLKSSLTKIKRNIIILLILVSSVFLIVNQITNGFLLLRYKGESENTLTGVKDKTLNSLTTNRFNIFLSDLNLLFDYGVMGVGVGASKYLRKDFKGISSHIEMSRLVAEHGIFGIIFNLLVIFVFMDLLMISPRYKYKGLVVALFVIGWYTSFHAATRTYITPMLIGFSLVSIVQSKRKSIDKIN